MKLLKSWKLSFNNDIINENSIITYIKEVIGINILNDSYKLNSNCTNYSLIEKIIYDICQYQLKNILNKNFEDYEVEFWLKSFDHNNNNVFHFDTDEYNRCLGVEPNELKNPILSIIVYFSDNTNNPTMITDITDKSLDENSLINCENISLSFPRAFKMITFEGGKYLHGDCKLSKEKQIDRNILVINIWKKENIPKYLPVFNYQTIKYNYCYKYKKEINEYNFSNDDIFFTCKEHGRINSVLNDKIFINNFNMFKNILKNKNLDIFNPIKTFLQELKCTCDNIEIIKNNENKSMDELIATDNDLIGIINNENKSMDELIATDNDLIGIIKYNNLDRFKQRHHYSQFYTIDICNWLMHEFKNNNSLDEKQNIDIEQVPSVFLFILMSLNYRILPLINDVYKLDNINISLNIFQGFLKKYSFNKQNKLHINENSQLLTIYILLESTVETKNSILFFDDGMKYNLKKGDILIHNSKESSYNIPTTEGDNYYIILYLNKNT